MTLLEAAERLHIDAPLLVRLNQPRPELKGLQLSSALMRGTRLRTKPGLEVPEYTHAHAPCTHRACAVHVPCTCRARTVHAPCTHRARTVHAPCCLGDACVCMCTCPGR